MRYVGKLAAKVGFTLALKVLKDDIGYYIGTVHKGRPMSRESVEYFPTDVAAIIALNGDTWTQRLHS